ncbi:MAG: TetR/AcrR family transcriptional regulator [Trebonia sp.]
MQQVSAAPSASTGSPTVESQRRERKKRQTRDALVHAALTLFDAKGYDHTAVREITDAVDVSERTFFRYFANKEDLALSFIRDGSAALMRELASRPAAEPPMTALGNAFRGSLGALTADEAQPGGKSLYLRVIMLIVTTPTLLAAHLRVRNDQDEEVVRVLAEREGVDPVADLRPRIAAAVFGGLVFTAHQAWQTEGNGSVEAMIAAYDACAERLPAAIGGHWS